MNDFRGVPPIKEARREDWVNMAMAQAKEYFKTLKQYEIEKQVQEGIIEWRKTAQAEIDLKLKTWNAKEEIRFSKWKKAFLKRKAALVPNDIDLFFLRLDGDSLTLVRRSSCCGALFEVEQDSNTKHNHKKMVARVRSLNVDSMLKKYLSNKNAVKHSTKHLIIEALKNGPFCLKDLEHINTTPSNKRQVIAWLLRVKWIVEIDDYREGRRCKFWDLNFDKVDFFR